MMPAQPDPSPTPVALNGANTPAKDNMTTQGTEGRRYGQMGFAGEPINLNVVNADVRDILNYITEQYGINFVIDSSVGAVPVTVNVQDVPWNYALDAILRANKLGVDVNGNILRVATSETLAKESETQRVIKDAQLSNSPLVTEFIRLNYARASGTLAMTRALRALLPVVRRISATAAALAVISPVAAAIRVCCLSSSVVCPAWARLKWKVGAIL
jgi:type II secretory pathway component HofQ